MAIIKVRNPAIDLDAAEIPNLDAAKITSGSFADARIPNLATSKITSGTFADARIAASSVNQHATSFDDNKLVNDISTLALRQSSNENRAAYNTNSMYVDVFQDSTGITNLTNAVRSSSEYVDTNLVTQHTLFNYNMEHTSGDNNTGSLTPTSNINGSYTSTTRAKFNNRSLYGMDSVNPMFRHYDANGIATGDFHFQVFLHTNGLSSNSYFQGLNLNFGSGNKIQIWKFRSGYSHGGWVFEYDGGTTNHWENNGNSAWHHFAITRESGTIKVWKNGTQYLTWSQSNALTEIILGGTNGAANNADSSTISSSYYDEFIFDNAVRSGYEVSNSSVTVPTSNLSNFSSGSLSATGSFESNAITAPSSVSSMGAIMTYQDNAGTNTLNTDIVLKLSADGGSNYSTATLTAMPDFATGIKMAKVNDLSVTAGTSLKYKISFANQASGSKEARIRGVSLQY